METAAKYQVYETNNKLQGYPDLDRRFTDSFLKKAYERQISEERISYKVTLTEDDLELIDFEVQEMIGDPLKKADFKRELTENFNRTLLQLRGEGGICGGMVCSWAHRYLVTGDPRAPLDQDQDDARRLQGEQEVTAFKRSYLNKKDATEVARVKALKTKGMFETTVIQSAHFPNTTNKFNQATLIILNWVYYDENVPCLLNVQIGKTYHAIGLLYCDGSYYVLEPNYGLYEFERREDASREVMNHFIRRLAPSSPWQLKSFSNAA